VELRHREDSPPGLHVRIPVDPTAVKRDLLDYKRLLYEQSRNSLSYLYRSHLLK